MKVYSHAVSLLIKEQKRKTAEHKNKRKNHWLIFEGRQKGNIDYRGMTTVVCMQMWTDTE